MQYLFAYRKPPTGLLFMTHNRQIGVKQIFSFVDLTGMVQAYNLNQHFRISKPGHRAVNTAL